MFSLETQLGIEKCWKRGCCPLWYTGIQDLLEEGEKVEERAGYGESYSAENIEGRF